jgi:hypothetical protein
MSAHPRRTAEFAVVEKAAPGLRAQQLYEEARRASQDHLRELAAAIDQVRTLSEAVVEAGDLYGPGVHDLAERLAEELFWRGKTLEKLGGLPGAPAAAAEPAREVG